MPSRQLSNQFRIADCELQIEDLVLTNERVIPCMGRGPENSPRNRSTFEELETHCNEIRNPQSAIRNPQFAIRNSQFAILVPLRCTMDTTNGIAGDQEFLIGRNDISCHAASVFAD